MPSVANHLARTLRGGMYLSAALAASRWPNAVTGRYRTLVRAAIAISLAFAGLASVAAQAQDDIRGLVDELMRTMRLRDFLEPFPAHVKQGMRQSPEWNSLNPDRRQALDRLADETLNADRLAADVANTLLQQADPAVVRRYLEAARTPLTARIQALELERFRALSTPDGAARMREALGQVAPQRQAIVAELDRLTGAAESAATLNASIVVAVQAMQGRAGDDPSAQLARTREMVLAPTRLQIQQLYLMVYQPLSDEDLNAYVDEHRKPAIQAMLPVLNRVMLRAYTGAILDFFDRLRALDKAGRGA